MKKKVNKNKFDKYIGILIVVFGMVFNEFTIRYISNGAIRIATFEKSVFLIIIQLLIISIGIYIFLIGKTAVKNLSLLFVTTVVLLTLLEFFLSFESLQNLNSDSPIWIPAEYKEASSKINQAHFEKAKQNKNGFNDFNHSYHKNDIGTTRISILGDSFIWGHGVQDSIIWTHKLEKLFELDNIKVEIFNWGKSGWSTLDQFNFFIEEGYKYEFDYLLFAFVVNDPDLHKSDLEFFIHQEGFVYQKIFKPISSIWPNSISLFYDLTNNLFNKYFSYGYMNWLKFNLYEPNNLENYSQLIKELKDFMIRDNRDFFFVLTPENHHNFLDNYFFQIIQIFEKHDIEYFNLYPIIKDSLSRFSLRELWANPADGHPGEIVTKLYASEIYKYLLNREQNKSNKYINEK